MSNFEILNGNELIIQGGLEAGFSLYTGYPGSPLADYFNILYHKRNELEGKGIKVCIANSEANAAAMASGSKQAGRDCLLAMKSMGLHVASDALSVGNFANPGETFVDPETKEELSPGVVVVVGDDPWSISTSTPADSRYLYKHLHIPFLEPSNPQELKDWIGHALYISRRTSVYQGLLLTTFLAEGGGRVETFQEAEVDSSKVDLNPAEFDLSKNVMVPPNSLKADVTMINERFPKVIDVMASLDLDKVFGPENSDVGVISSGVIFETVKQVMEESNAIETISLFKLASSYPLVPHKLKPWLQSKKTVIVIEEKREFLETELSKFCLDHGIQIQLFGKKIGDKEGFPAHGGLNYEIITNKMGEVFHHLGITTCQNLEHELTNWDKALPRRLPTFCPGCPHRETLSLLKELRADLKKEGVDLITHGDVGCYSLSFLPPFKEMHNLSAMGQGGALGLGVDLFTKNPSVILMGDSTFFHSGMTDVSNSLQAEHNITYILLDNENTAMTGHQMTPSSGMNVQGLERPKQDMVSVAKSLGVKDVIEVNPSDRYFYKNLMGDYVRRPGVKVIVSRKECALTFHGRRKAKERKIFSANKTIEKQSFYQINTDACEDCRACVDATGCPGLTQVFDAYGTKVKIDPQICVADSYCTMIKACPSFEEVVVTDYHPTKFAKQKKNNLNFTHIPLPKIVKTFDEISNGHDWRLVVTGVGGSGVTTISRVLAEAAREMDGRDDLNFKFVDQKGLAQRNGNVTGHLSIFGKDKSYGAVTPLGTADLLVSPDLLDGMNQIQFLASEGYAIFDEKFQVPLSIMLDNGEEKPPENEAVLKEMAKERLGENIAFLPFKDSCYKLFGKSVYASAMVLGAAYQTGRLPFSLKNMKDAFKNTMRPEEYETNWQAFQLGRMAWYEGRESFLENIKGEQAPSKEKWMFDSLKESLLSWHRSDTVIDRYKSQLKKLAQAYPEMKRDYLAQYLHDIYIYDRGVNSENFVKEALELRHNYKNDLEREIALRTLAKTYFIKDEVFVSHIMISPYKRFIDRQEYEGLGKSYDLRRINRPEFDIFGKRYSFDISPKDWMLKLMRHMRILRIILPNWHSQEKEIARKTRDQIVNHLWKKPESEIYSALKRIENIKGYREVRYQKASVLS
jgi:indolepyruvate ferredoxin oxidoreductase